MENNSIEETISKLLDLANTLEAIDFAEDSKLIRKLIEEYYKLEIDTNELSDEIRRLTSTDEEDNTYSGGIYE